MKNLTMFLFYALAAAFGGIAVSPASDDAAKLQGVWVAEKVLSSGRSVPSGKFPFELHFEDSKLTFKFVGSSIGEDRVHEFVLDSTQKPATIDITREFRGKLATVRGIYKFEKDKLIICSLRGTDGQPSSERPTSFDSSREVRSDLLILKRKPVTDE